MSYDNALVAAKLRRWEKYLKEYSLPLWEEIPNFGLYMEQVLVLLKEYLDYLPPELKDEQLITAAAINNYVRNKYMPEPQKKRYYRVHIAYLVMICTLKRSLSIATLQKMIPVGIEEEQVREIYTAYVRRHKHSANFFITQIRQIAGPILQHENDVNNEMATSETEELIEAAAILSGLSGLLAEKLLLLEGQRLKSTEDSFRLPENS